MNIFNPFRRRKPKAPPHVHSWKPIEVAHGKQDGYPATTILQLCDCGDYRTAAAWGHWTLEQVSAGEIHRDVLELKRMAAL